MGNIIEIRSRDVVKTCGQGHIVPGMKSNNVLSKRKEKTLIMAYLGIMTKAVLSVDNSQMANTYTHFSRHFFQPNGELTISYVVSTQVP
jgi:hypothetical protein